MEPDWGNALSIFKRKIEANKNRAMDIPKANRNTKPRFNDSACQQIIAARPRLRVSPANHRSLRLPEVSSSYAKLRRNNRRGRVLTALSKGHKQNKSVIATPSSKDCKAGSQ